MAIDGRSGRGGLILIPATRTGHVPKVHFLGIERERDGFALEGLAPRGQVEGPVAVAGKHVDLTVVAREETSRQPQSDRLLAVEAARPIAVDADPEGSSRQRAPGEGDGPVRAVEGIADEEVDQLAGKLPGVAGIHGGEVPLPHGPFDGMRRLGDEREVGPVVTGVVAEPSDHAPAGHGAQKVILAQRGEAHQLPVVIHPQFSPVGG